MEVIQNWRQVLCVAATMGGLGLRSGAADPAPAITLTRANENVVIQFTGTLQSADALSGPWTDLAPAISPYTNAAAGSQRFYRTRQPASGGVFAGTSIVAWTLTGPLQRHFELAFAGLPDGFFPPKRVKPYFDGALKMGASELQVQLRVRGNSSLQECPFPKLKVKISPEQRAGTPFADAREIKIGTHCAEGGFGNIGRLRDERATFREALAYEAMTALGFAGPRVRRARIDFHDTSPTNGVSEVGWALDRQAMILDDADVVAERLGGRALDDAEITALTRAGFSPQLITDLRCFHALLGNWDFALSEDGAGLGNTDVIELPNGQLLPIAGDFDLSSWVTGLPRAVAPRDYHPEWPALERETRYALEQIQRAVPAPLLAAARDRFAAKRTALEALIGAAEIDEPGRANARDHVAAFFTALAALGN